MSHSLRGGGAVAMVLVGIMDGLIKFLGVFECVVVWRAVRSMAVSEGGLMERTSCHVFSVRWSRCRYGGSRGGTLCRGVEG